MLSPRLFVSYSRRDKAFVDALVKELQRRGFRIFLDTSDIDPGDNFVARLTKEIARATAIVAVISEHYSLSHWAQAELYHALAQGKAAVDYFTKALSLDPKLAKAYRDRGWERVILHEWTASIADTTEAIKLTPDDPLAYENRAAALAGAGDWNGAVEDYTRALDRSPHDHEIYVMRAEARANADDLSGAIADLNRAIQIHPDSAKAYRLRGRIKQQLGDEHGADDDFQKAKALESASTHRSS